MKTKNNVITALTVILLIIALTVVIFKAFDIHLDIVTYHKANDGEYTFTFKGAFKNVRKVKISKNSKKICSLPFNAKSDVFSDGYKIKWEDVNFDGATDLLLISAIDDDKDIHYTAYISDNANNTFIYKEALADLPNVTVDTEKKMLFTSHTSKTFIEDPEPNTPDNYEEKKAITKYEYKNGEPLATEERAITFYSETYY